MKIRHVLSFDVEDYFQVLNLRAHCPRERWDEYELRCPDATRRILDILDEFETKASFFCLGWIAERAEGLMREIVERGHELASHGYDHQVLPELGEEGFRQDLSKTTAILEDVTGVRVRSFRACTWSIGPKTPWAFSVLAEQGFWNDSSIHPIRHPDYGVPGAELGPQFLEVGDTRIFELPPLVAEFMGRRMPLGGGGYLRLFPVRWISRALRAREARGVASCIYLHPWEFDAAQPRFPVKGLRGFRHYVGLAKTEAKLRFLLKRHRFTTLAELGAEARA